MKRSRFMEEQHVGILKVLEWSLPTAEAMRDNAIAKVIDGNAR